MKTLLIYSGGMDSTVLLYWLKFLGHDVVTLGVNYGQKHRKELEHAEAIAEVAGVPFRIADLSALRPLLAGSSQTDDSVEVPEGHYAEESMKKTVVPNRNMIMLAVAGGYAISQGCEEIAFAAHAGDHAIYPDCRPVFADALDKALGLADWAPLRLRRPFIEMTKTDIARLGKLLDAPLSSTWSCYKGGAKHCGKCGTCVERKEALSGFDPTDYENEPSLF